MLLPDTGQLYFITGLSGAGKSQVLKFLEDVGFFCIDNLPPVLIDKFLSVISSSSLKSRNIALGIDIRSREFFDHFQFYLTSLREQKIGYRLIFMDAIDETLVKRFGETRREHPLNSQGNLLSRIRTERELLAVFKKMADEVIDTSNMNLKELSTRLQEMFRGSVSDSFYLSIVSFGFKYGIPISADLVFDVRFIPNPFYIKELGPLTGNDPRVLKNVMSHAVTKKFVKQVYNMIVSLQPFYHKEGKNSLEIAFGCTGGQHRSVAIANYLKKMFSSNYHVKLYHRQLDSSASEQHRHGNY